MKLILMVLTCFVLLSCEESQTENKKKEAEKEINSKVNKAVRLILSGSKQDLEKATNLLEEAYKLDSSNSNTVYNLSEVHIKSEQLDKAAAILKQYLKDNSKNTELRFKYARVLLCLSDTEEANKQLNICNKELIHKFSIEKKSGILIERIYVLFLLDKNDEIDLIYSRYSEKYPEIYEYTIDQVKNGSKSDLLPCK
ncbi:MAG: tetratricopeptide repeat protein [Brumimicrobium sp.]